MVTHRLLRTWISLAIEILGSQEAVAGRGYAAVFSPRLPRAALLRQVIIPIYSTSLPFSAYIELCPAQLRQAGLLSMLFHKVPPRMQHLAVEHALNASLKQAVRSGVQRASRERQEPVQATVFHESHFRRRSLVGGTKRPPEKANSDALRRAWTRGRGMGSLTMRAMYGAQPERMLREHQMDASASAEEMSGSEAYSADNGRPKRSITVV